MKAFALALFAGWIVGVLFEWLKLPLPAPPPLGLVGATGLTLGGIFYEWLRQFFANANT